jgi:uncharacterized surface protein with fasciclin (FAS1) repeats
MKRINRLQVLACSAVIFALAACTDVWNEHYQPDSSVNENKTLWQLIEEDENLQAFAELLKATGYDSLLMMNRNYTVWAPTVFEVPLLEGATDSLLEVYRKEIVENHIANYSHVAGGIRDREDEKNYKRVVMLNGKSYHFEGSYNGGYTFSNHKLKTTNIVAKNGILHKLDGAVDFAANIWEKLPKLESVDSLWNYLQRAYSEKFDPNSSVKGPIVDGQVTFLDSAWTIECRWFSEIGYLNREDSSYTMYALTNSAWTDMLALTKTYYKYQESLVDENNNKTSAEICDSIAKELICRNLVFSNTVNKKFFAGEKDTLISNYRYGRQIFTGEEAYALNDGLVDSYSLSNGTLNIIDAVNYKPLTCWHDTIRIQGEELKAEERYPDMDDMNDKDGKGFTNARKELITIPKDRLYYDPFSGDSIPLIDSISGNSVCAFIADEGSDVNPNFNFYIDNVLSAKYRIWLVLLPPQVIDPTDTYFVKPNKFTARLYYDNGKGEQTNTALKTKDGSTTFYSDPEKIDRILLADCFEIPVCEANLSKINSSAQVKTRLHIESTITFGNRNGENKGAVKDPSKWKYDNSFRIDEVIFEPLPADYKSKE